MKVKSEVFAVGGNSQGGPEHCCLHEKEETGPTQLQRRTAAPRACVNWRSSSWGVLTMRYLPNDWDTCDFIWSGGGGSPLSFLFIYLGAKPVDEHTHLQPFNVFFPAFNLPCPMWSTDLAAGWVEGSTCPTPNHFLPQNELQCPFLWYVFLSLPSSWSSAPSIPSIL